MFGAYFSISCIVKVIVSYSRFLAPLRAMFGVGLEGVSVQGSFPHGSGSWSAQTSAKDMDRNRQRSEPSLGRTGERSCLRSE